MSGVESLRRFVAERLSCAAEEIFRVFERTVFEYEREILRQRGLLERARAPEGGRGAPELRPRPRNELPHLHPVLKERLCPQETDLGVDHGDQGPPHVKEEQQEEVQEVQVEQEFGPNGASGASLSAQEEEDHLKQEPSGFLCVPEGPGPRGAEGVEPQRRRRGEDVDFPPHRQFGGHAARKSFTCGICGKGFRFRCRLNLHMRVHTGEKLYSCDTCGKRFTQKTNVERHQRIHTGENPYVCKVCGKGFKQVAERNVHLRSHTDERLYCCGTCGKRLKTKQTMLVHMRTHTGERPFVCSTCGRSFIQATTLHQHMKNHTH